MDEELEMQKGTSLLENNSLLQVLQGISANNNINNSKDIFYLLYVLQTVFILYLHSNTAVSISMSLSQMNKQNLSSSNMATTPWLIGGRSQAGLSSFLVLQTLPHSWSDKSGFIV